MYHQILRGGHRHSYSRKFGSSNNSGRHFASTRNPVIDFGAKAVGSKNNFPHLMIIENEK